MSGNATPQGLGLSAGMAQTLEVLRSKGCRVFGPGPVTPGATTPTADQTNSLPGMHVQISCGSLFVEGFGGTADEALADAVMKLDGRDEGGQVVTPPAGGGW